MDGAAIERKLIRCPASLSNGIRFVVATPDHDAQIRQLLRDTPMAGRISLSMGHEPSHFAAAAIAGADHRTIVAIDNEQVVAMGTVSTRQRFINGQVVRIGYLSGLRLASSSRGHATILRKGYDLLHELHRANGPAMYFTSIVADNLRARRLLERGIEGMPTYRFLGEIVTLVIGRKRGKSHRPKTNTRIGDEKFGSAIGRVTQSSWAKISIDAVVRVGRFAVAGTGTGEFSSRVWDERTSPPNARALAYGINDRPNKMLFADTRPHSVECAHSSILEPRYWKRPRFPAIGTAISNAYVSHVAGDPDRPELLASMIDAFGDIARARRIDYLTIGFDARDPQLAFLRKTFRPREYMSRIYAVHWEDGRELAASLDDRLLAPDVALL